MMLEMAQGLVTMLRDPMVRTILAVVAICVTVSLFLIARRRKNLSYMLSDTRVLGVHEAVNPSRVEILFDGAPVTDVHLVMITVNNSGNEPIKVDDFERPLRFGWAEPARILTAEVVEVSPETLQPMVKAGINDIALEPLLLNPGDWLRIKTLINQAGKLSVDARVVGVKRIGKTIAAGKVSFPRTLAWAAGLAVAGLIAMWVGEASGLLPPNGQAELRMAEAGALVIIFLILDELKTNVLALRDHYREKKDTPK